MCFDGNVTYVCTEIVFNLFRVVWNIISSVLCVYWH